MLLSCDTGKWTTYRAMAEDTVDSVVDVGGLQTEAQECRTNGYMLEGGKDWNPTSFISLIQDYGMDIDVRNTAAVVIRTHKDFFCRCFSFSDSHHQTKYS